MSRLLITTFALSLFLSASPAHALYLKLPDGKTPTKYQNSARKVIPQGTKVSNQPWRQRNDQRRLDLKNIGTAFFRYRQAHKTIPKSVLITEEKEICRWDASSCTGLLDLKDLLSPYLTSMPVDPHAEGNGTGYVVKKDYKERVFLRAPKAEQGWAIRQQN